MPAYPNSLFITFYGGNIVCIAKVKETLYDPKANRTQVEFVRVYYDCTSTTYYRHLQHTKERLWVSADDLHIY